MPSIADTIRQITSTLIDFGISPEEAPIEARMMLQRATGFSQEKLLASRANDVSARASETLTHMLKRRKTREPLAYILGEKEFYGLKFQVDRRVLIPRPETEMLVDLCIDFCREYRPNSPNVCDIGTGSGIIAISIARQLPDARVTAIDISEDALDLAKLNAVKHGVEIDFAVEDATQPRRLTEFDIVVSNPPYIRSQALRSLEPEVRDWEPRLALNGGPDGMKVLEPLIRSLPDLMRPDAPSAALIEIDPPVANRSFDLASEIVTGGYVDLRRDFAGLERVLIVVRD